MLTCCGGGLAVFHLEILPSSCASRARRGCKIAACQWCSCGSSELSWDAAAHGCSNGPRPGSEDPLDHGADPNRVLHHVLSPFMLAYCARSLKCRKLLVEAGADVNFNNPRGKPVLMMTVDNGMTGIVKYLLEVGADPNIHDREFFVDLLLLSSGSLPFLSQYLKYGKFPIMLAAAREHHELVEIQFPWTKPIPSVPDWSVDGIIGTMKYLHFEPQESVEKQKADAKSRGKEAFAKGAALMQPTTMCWYMLGSKFRAVEKDPLEATLFSNRSLCWLRLREGERALSDARRCKSKTLRPAAHIGRRHGTVRHSSYSLSLLKG
ncbi:hypothetical protein PAHAL_3G487400 [Panicum hallii]|uniref:Uncharacterized protein n=1 Tax=Panicum hallii TaxID=206008 RepID=A0A2T8KM13_9POAL|nr:hypothetical protein PAHAL_3G487400 [Panicum hallii]